MTIGRNTPALAAADAVPVLQWANGKPVAKGAGMARFNPLIGFHSEIGKNADFDERMIGAGTARTTIRHQRDGGSAEVAHWYFGETLALFPVTSGPPVPTMAALVKHAAHTANAGIGARWGQGVPSNLAVRCILALPGAGGELPEPVIVQLAMRSRSTDVLLAALLAHVAHCEAADALIDRARHPEPVTCHELAWTLTAGAEISVGRGDTSDITPFIVADAAPVTRADLKGRWCSPDTDALALASWAGIVAWATEYAVEREASYV